MAMFWKVSCNVAAELSAHVRKLNNYQSILAGLVSADEAAFVTNKLGTAKKISRVEKPFRRNRNNV
jgi:hypothetical protein